MSTFLKYVATDLYSRYDDKISDLCIVFPNRRASLYFKKYLSELSQKPIWAPNTTTINDLFQDISGLELADNIKLLFELYTIYKQVKKSEESFDDFYYWGEMMLNDFDDIDKYLVDPEDLFKNLKSLKSIQEQFTYLSSEQIEAIQQFWHSFEPEKKSEQQENFISIWNVLLNIYKAFSARLSELGIAYEGMIYKLVAAKIKGTETIELPYKKFVFAGFNALNSCEKSLFTYLQNNKLADFYWDYDDQYINYDVNEAGYFLRENIRNFKAPETFVNQDIFNGLKQKKNIEIISVPSDIGQTQVISDILANNNQIYTESPNKAAIVLADEDLLVPILHSIPDSIDKVNITMGYPVSNTPIYSLLEHLIDLQKNIKQSKVSTTFYNKNVISILNHQYINTQFKSEASQLLQSIRSKNKIIIPQEDLTVCDFFKVIFSKANNYVDFADYLLNILHYIYNSLNSEVKENTIHTVSLEREYIYHIYLSINRIKDVLSEQNIEIRIETFIRLTRKIIKNLRIPFTGEPLSGLQLMGILETRLLDFETLFITSLNEGILPKTDATLSFVPYNLRKGFGLPTIEHQDAIYAYYFYRLMQRAKNITLIYNSSSDGIQTGEMSRFLYQLKYESDYRIAEKSLRYNINITQANEIIIEKSEEIFEKLNKFIPSRGGTKYLSPSALNTYIKCKLQFYFRYIAELREQDDITEEIDAPLFGNILHETMDYLYKDFICKEVNEELLKQITNTQVNEAIDYAFKTVYFKSDQANYTGKNIIIREMISKYVQQILDIDKSITPFEILSLEDTYETEITISINESFEQIKLGGKIDRVDKLNNHIRIIDYKTGSDTLEFNSMESLFTDASSNRKSAVFQTFLYSKFYNDLKKPSLPLTPGVYSVRKLFGDNFEFRILNKQSKLFIDDYKQVSDEFHEHLIQLIEKIVDHTEPFSQTEETRNCEYCPYRKICHR